MTWHDFTLLDNSVWQCTCVKTVMSQHPGSHFLIISSVLCTDGNDNYEQLVHCGEFGSNVWTHKDSTGQTMNQVMTPFQQWFGKPCLCGATISVGKKCVYVEEYEGFSSEQSTNIPNGDLCCGCRFHWTIATQVHGETIIGTCSTTFDHSLVMKSFWPVFVIELSDTDVRLCHKTCALLLEWFLIALSQGKVVFSDEGAVYCSSLSWNVFWS